MQTAKRITTNKVNEVVNQALSEYNDGINDIQLFRDGELSQPNNPNKIFKIQMLTSSISELVHGFQTVSNAFGHLEIIDYQKDSYSSTVVDCVGGKKNSTIYFKKSADMISEDMKLVAKIAETNLREEVAAFNANLIASEENELREIEKAEMLEVQQLRQQEQNKLNRSKRKKELQEKLAA